MSKILFNDNWEFALLPNDSEISDTINADFKKIDIPHDFLIYDTNDLYKSADGWYRKKFTVTDTGVSDFILYFDGIYMNSTIYINNTPVYTEENGYNSFQVNISDFINDGENTVMVCVRHKSPCSRWYSGAGIFRNVYIDKLSPVHFEPYGIYISADANTGKVYVSSEICLKDSKISPLEITHTVLFDNKEILTATGNTDKEIYETEFALDNIKLWSLDERNLYTLRSVIKSDGKILDSADNVFGFRKVKFDPDNGFSLNGIEMKIKGVCLHHDLGLFGSAFNKEALRRQLLIMKDMGVNAIRTSHNSPAPELIELCDEMGFLVDDEAFDMWELPKTEFDNARFFKDTAHKDMKNHVKRDRNHPSVIMWSIGNEIYDTHASDHGYEIAEMLKDYVYEYDFKKNAHATIASNYIEWDKAQRIGKMLGLSGYNYTERCYDDHHKKYPETVIYGSETSSEVRSRGIYHFPADRKCLSHEDNQCSSLANSCVIWGKPAEDAWIEDRDRKFVCGQFIWTGIDYIGEPTPYSTKNSYFGAVDTAGLPKDIFWFYKSVWNDKCGYFVHLFPYLDMNEGEEIDVMAYTNAPYCEIFLNNKSLGKEKIGGNTLHYSKKSVYEKGTLKAVAYDENGKIVAEDEKKSFTDPVKIILSPEKNIIKTDGEDVVFVKVSTVDKDNITVENARNRIYIYVEGGKLLGMDNGDSTDYEQYKTNNRRLFSGYLVFAVKANADSDKIKITAKSKDLSSAYCEIETEKVTPRKGISFNYSVQEEEMTKTDVPIRKIELTTNNTNLNANCPEADIKFKILPENSTYGKESVTAKAVTKNGASSLIASCEKNDDNIHVKAYGDGEFVLRVTANNKSFCPQVISELEFNAKGLGSAQKSPYKFINANMLDFCSEGINIVGESAVSGFKSGKYIVYKDFDFGRSGSKEIILYMGHNFRKDVNVTLTAGGKEQKIIFPDNNLWNGFAPVKFELSETVTGKTDIKFEVSDCVTMGGFEFIPQSESTALIKAADFDDIYGDEFKADSDMIRNIGNNVVVSFNNFDLGEKVSKITVSGKTPNELNSIQLRATKDNVQKTILLEFKKSDDISEQTFTLSETLSGKYDISFVFLPGSDFDFESFRFGV